MNEQKPPGGIEWTRVFGRKGYTANPIRGCMHRCEWTMPDGAVAKCYAKSIATERKARNHYPKGFEHVTFHPEELIHIERRKVASGIFIGSMSDLFGQDVKPEWISQILETVRACPQHVFFSLTKNPGKMAQFKPFPDNLWVGVSAPPSFMFGKELSRDQRLTWYDNALKSLVRTDAKIRWTSIEPLSMDFSEVLHDFDGGLEWAVIGAASSGYKTYQPDEDDLRKTLEALDGIPKFFNGNLCRTMAIRVCGKWLEDFPPDTTPVQPDLLEIGYNEVMKGRGL